MVEGGGVGSGEVGEDLAVESDFGRLETFHKTAVGDASGAGCGINANLPQGAEGSLFGAAIAKGVLPAMINGIGGVAVKFGTTHPEALGGADHSGAAFA